MNPIATENPVPPTRDRMQTSFFQQEDRIALLTVAGRATQRRIGGQLDCAEFTVTADTEPPLTIESAAAVCRDLKRAPDVVVMTGGKELFAPGGSVEVLRTLLPESRLVIVTSCGERDTVSRALRAGVSAIVCEDRLDECLGTIIRAVHGGQICIPGTMTTPIDTRSFSERERQVLDHVTRGLTNSQIAAKLYLSESTVKSHLASSFRKLGLCSRAEAAAAWTEVLDEEAEQRAMLSRIAAQEAGRVASLTERLATPSAPFLRRAAA